ncbi:hypothetical protein BgiMline_020760 [Biomphalaria glabrata]
MTQTHVTQRQGKKIEDPMLCIKGGTFRQTGLKVKCQALMSTHSSWCDQEQELRLDNHSQITWTAGPCGNFDRSNLWSGHPYIQVVTAVIFQHL